MEDAAFADQLRATLLHAIEHEGTMMDAAVYAARPRVERIKEYVALGLMRLALFIQGKRY